MFLPRRIGRAPPRPGASKVVSTVPVPTNSLDPMVPCAGLVIQATCAVHEERSSISTRTSLVSALEMLAPRSVAYVDVEVKQDETTNNADSGRWIYIRSRTPKHAKLLLRALQPTSMTRDIPHALIASSGALIAPPLPVQDALLLSGSSEVKYWSKLPQRVRNAAAKRATLQDEQRERTRREKRRRKVERRRARRRASRTTEQT